MPLDEKDSAYQMVEIIKRKAPEFLDLMSASTDAEFESAFDALIGRAVGQLETQKVNYKSLDEEGLSGVFAAALSMPGITVSPERFSNGHVDLHISATYCNPEKSKLAEAKIYNGPQYHIKGLEQLFNRYTTGRETRGFLLVYYRKEKISELVKKIRDDMDTTLPLNQNGKTSNHSLQWSFLSNHTHSSGDKKDVFHVGCNLYIDEVLPVKSIKTSVSKKVKESKEPKKKTAKKAASKRGKNGKKEK